MSLPRRDFLFAGASFAAASAFAAAPRRRIAVVKPVAACRAAERGYGAMLVKHLVRWLASGGVAVDVVDDVQLDAALAGRALAFFPLFTDPTRAQLAAFDRFTAWGGKAFVFYSFSPALASRMGVAVVGYKKPPAGTFADVRFLSGAPSGAPVHFLQASANVCSARSAAGGRVVAEWHDAAGRDAGEAAVIASSRGWWMTHVLQADGDEEAKAQFLLSVCGAAVPGSWSMAAWKSAKQAQAAADRAYAAAQKPRPGEIHAVWDQSGQGLYPGDWARTFRLLVAAHVTDLYVNVAGPAFAHYPSRHVPASAVLQTRDDQLAACLAAAKGTGVRVHAWVICFNATRATPARLADFGAKDWRLTDRVTGRLTEYLDPSKGALRARLLAVLEEVARRYPVHGVHADFVRWYERAKLPPDAAQTIATFVAQARLRVKAARAGAIFSTAVFGKYPSCVKAVGQDWEAWLDAGLVDQLVAMNYVEDSAKYAAFVAQQGRTRAHARRIVSGIGVTANESRLKPRQVIDQVLAARRAGLAGVALFDLDWRLANEILPLLRLGCF